jgi:hypothetical protein
VSILSYRVGEEFDLIVNSIKELISREWNTREYFKVDKEKVRGLFQKLRDLGLFQYLRDCKREEALLINELLAENLLPGVITNTAIGVRVAEIEDSPIGIGLKDKIGNLEEVELLITEKGVTIPSKVKWELIEPIDPLYKVYLVREASWDEKRVNLQEMLLLSSSQIIGSAKACISLAIDYAKTREAFGRPIGSYQAVKHKLVNNAIGLELARSLYLTREAEKIDPKKVLKYSFQKSYNAILDSIQVHGGIGFTTQTDLHLHLRRIVSIYKTLE